MGFKPAARHRVAFDLLPVRVETYAGHAARLASWPIVREGDPGRRINRSRSGFLREAIPRMRAASAVNLRWQVGQEIGGRADGHLEKNVACRALLGGVS